MEAEFAGQGGHFGLAGPGKDAGAISGADRRLVAGHKHLEDAEELVEEIRGQERCKFAGVVGWGDFDYVAADDV